MLILQTSIFNLNFFLAGANPVLYTPGVDAVMHLDQVCTKKCCHRLKQLFFS